MNYIDIVSNGKPACISEIKPSNLVGYVTFLYFKSTGFESLIIYLGAFV